MAQYFVTSRFQTSSRDQDQRQLSTKEAFKLKLATLDESAVYLFPNTSSAPTTSLPTSPSQASDFSIPSELTLSAVDTDSGSLHYGPSFSNSPRSPRPESESQLVFPEFSYGGEETPNSDKEVCSATPFHHDIAAEVQKTGALTGANLDNGRVRHRQTFLSYFLPDSTQPAVDIKVDSDQPSTTPPTRGHNVDQQHPLPFLSYILSFFSLDESTEELLMSDHDTKKSALFPGPRLRTFDDEKAVLVQEADDDARREKLHGLAKLLAEEKSNSQYVVRQAFWSHADSIPAHPPAL